MKGTIFRLAILCLVATTVFCGETAAANTVVQGLGASFSNQIYSLWFMLLVMASQMMQP